MKYTTMNMAAMIEKATPIVTTSESYAAMG